MASNVGSNSPNGTEVDGFEIQMDRANDGSVAISPTNSNSTPNKISMLREEMNGIEINGAISIASSEVETDLEKDADLSMSMLASISESGISRTEEITSAERPMSAVERMSNDSLGSSGRPMSAMSAMSGHSFGSSTSPSRNRFSSSSSVSSSSTSSSMGNARKRLMDFISRDSSNRSCADCQCLLIDFTKMHCSFYNADMDETRMPLNVAGATSGIGSQTMDGYKRIALDFSKCHEEFKPPSEPMVRGRRKHTHEKFKNALSSIAHAVFICSMCSKAHIALGTSITTVKSITTDQWSHDEVQSIIKAEGNTRCNKILERYLSDGFRPGGNSNKETRELFVRAKYEVLAGILPRGPLAGSVPLLHTEGYNGGESRNNGIVQSLSNISNRSTDAEYELPDRLVDYFCIVSTNGQLENESQSYSSPSDLCFKTEVSDCYPDQNKYGVRGFPRHLPKFVFPNGCRPSKSQTPTLFTFTLTNESGTKMYGTAMHVYDANLDMDKIIKRSNRSGSNSGSPGGRVSNDQESDVFFLPKCLVVISHYAFFDVWRKFLLQIYHISIAPSPLPLERYIVNFMSEVPLPPMGLVAVNMTFANDEVVSISRPPINRLPLVNFSYKPLFTCLSVANVMVIVGSLLQESRVALFSKHASLLGSCCDGLSSLLFPMTWQGIYIPVLPISMTVDLLEAPIPFLVGSHRIYLDEFPIDKRPKGVIFVDLDYDLIHLGFDEDGDHRLPPFLPEKEAMKLKGQLDSCAGSEYIAPDTHKKGAVTNGEGALIPNEKRPLYCRMSVARYVQTRSEHLAKSNFAFTENKNLMPIEFAIGTLTDATDSSNNNFKMKGMKKKKDKISTTKDLRQPRHLLDLDSENETFEPTEIRNSFLRFMVAILQDSVSHISQSNEDEPIFLKEKFLSSTDAKSFLSDLLDSQMFERFIYSNVYEPENPSIRFFNDSVQAKKNRSKKSVGRRKETKFISDRSYDIVEIFTPPDPSSQGLSEEKFSHTKFPEKLDRSLFGKIRRANLNGAKRIHKRAKVPVQPSFSTSLALKQQVMADLLKPFSESQSANYVEKDANWALHAITFQASKAITSSRSTSFPADLMETAREILASIRHNQTRSIVDIMVFQQFWISHRIFPAQQLQMKPVNQRMLVKRNSWLRPVAVTNHWSRLKTSVTCIQSFYRSRRVVRVYNKTLRLIGKIQSIVRGYQARQKVLQEIVQRMSEYQQQITLLWERTSISLVYRSRFVLVNSLSPFLAHAMLESELVVLYEKLGVVYSDATLDTESLIAKSALHSTFVSIQSQLSSESSRAFLFPAEIDRNGERATKILEASFYIKSERVSIKHHIY